MLRRPAAEEEHDAQPALGFGHRATVPVVRAGDLEDRSDAEPHDEETAEPVRELEPAARLPHVLVRVEEPDADERDEAVEHVEARRLEVLRPRRATRRRRPAASSRPRPRSSRSTPVCRADSSSATPRARTGPRARWRRSRRNPRLGGSRTARARSVGYSVWSSAAANDDSWPRNRFFSTLPAGLRGNGSCADLDVGRHLEVREMLARRTCGCRPRSPSSLRAPARRP